MHQKEKRPMLFGPQIDTSMDRIKKISEFTVGTTRHSEGCWQAGDGTPDEKKLGMVDLKLVF